jgi:polyribonucleotide nucleotidyltransferase
LITIKINPEKIRDVIGKGGAVIRALTEETQTQIDISDDGTINIFATTGESGKAALEWIQYIVAVPESHTGRYLAPYLPTARRRGRRV